MPRAGAIPGRIALWLAEAQCGTVHARESKLNPRQPVDIARILLVIAILSALTVGSLYILRPFLPGLIWATTIVVATWPMMRAIQRRCGNRRWLATTIMILLLLIVIVLPLYQAISTLALHGSEIMAAIKGLPAYALPPPPEWIHSIPIAGMRIAHEWQTLSDAGPGGLLAKSNRTSRSRPTGCSGMRQSSACS